MVELTTNLPGFFSDISEVIRLFEGACEIRLMEAGQAAELTVPADAEPFTHQHSECDGEWREQYSFRGRAHSLTAAAVHPATGDARLDELETKKLLKRLVKNGAYQLMKQLTGVRPPWGSLTGIRPTRLFYERIAAGNSAEQAVRHIMDEFDVSAAKAQLLAEIYEVQAPLIEHPHNEFDLYIGIPFCTTRCAYCSFASDELGNGKLVEPYLNALQTELELCAADMARLGYNMRAAYIGGGTPTALSAEQLSRVLEWSISAFGAAGEWTVEAGRPDTIDAGKLRAILSAGVTRISINPQTMHDQTLRIIGRDHTVEDILRAYELARELGFTDINMDLIAALPDESIAMFEDTLTRVAALAPESITVHTLAIKRASKLHEQLYRPTDASSARTMVEQAATRLMGAGYQPYYLYRQKYMAGNLENVGYAKPGNACLYNIDIMEETTHNLALGAGAISKWIYPERRRIERAANVRNIELYIAQVKQMVERKRTIYEDI